MAGVQARAGKLVFYLEWGVHFQFAMLMFGSVLVFIGVAGFIIFVGQCWRIANETSEGSINQSTQSTSYPKSKMSVGDITNSPDNDQRN